MGVEFVVVIIFTHQASYSSCFFIVFVEFSLRVQQVLFFVVALLVTQMSNACFCCTFGASSVDFLIRCDANTGMNLDPSLVPKIDRSLMYFFSCLEVCILSEAAALKGSLCRSSAVVALTRPTCPGMTLYV